MVNLTSEETDYIKRTWRVAAQNIHNCGEVIFYKFFEKFPSYIVQFPKFKNSTLVQLKVCTKESKKSETPIHS